MNSPQKRNLTDELQSVLRAHALDAPTPDASVENILARTVGSAAAVASASVVESAAAARARSRWFAPNRILMAASASFAVVAAVSVPFVIASHQRSSSTTAHREGAVSVAAGAQSDAGKQAGAAADGSPVLGAQAPAAPGNLAFDSMGVRPCESADLVMALDTRAAAPAVASVVLTNRSNSSCLISGFPVVRPVTGGSSAPPAASAVPKASPGAVAESVPTLVLAPGTSAQATVDAANSAASSASGCVVTALSVALSTSADAVDFPFRSTSCAFEVHPLVAVPK